MIYLAFICFVLIFFPFSIGDFSSTLDDDGFIAFVKGAANFEQFCTKKGVTNRQSKQLMAHIYETSLGTLSFMRQNWLCANAKKRLIPFFSDQRMYRKNLDLLYKFLVNIYARNSVTKPKFVVKNSAIDLSYVEVVENLVRLSKFYCNGSELEETKALFLEFELENDLLFGCYKVKSKKLKKKRTEFEAMMAQMRKKVEEKAMEKKDQSGKEKRSNKRKWANGSPSSAMASLSLSAQRDAIFIYDIILDLPLHAMNDAIEDEAFLAFVQKRSDFKDILTHAIGEKPGAKEHYEREVTKFVNSAETVLGLLHFMKNKWHCANAKIKNGNECNKHRRYVNILYEYLFKIYKGIPAVKPIFQTDGRQRHLSRNLINVICLLIRISKLYFGTNFQDPKQIENVIEASTNLTLLNEKELGYSANLEFLNVTFEEHVLRMANESVVLKKENQKDEQISALTLEGFLRKQFDMFLEELLIKRVKMASEAKTELEKLKEKIKEMDENNLEAEKMKYYKKESGL